MAAERYPCSQHDETILLPDETTLSYSHVGRNRKDTFLFSQLGRTREDIVRHHAPELLDWVHSLQLPPTPSRGRLTDAQRDERYERNLARMRHEILDGSEGSEIRYQQFELHRLQAELCVVQALRHAWANAQIAGRFVPCPQLTAEETAIADMRRALAAHRRGVTDLFPEVPAQQLIVIPITTANWLLTAATYWTDTRPRETSEAWEATASAGELFYQVIDYPDDWKTPYFGSPPPQQILINSTYHRTWGDDVMGPPACYLDRQDPTIPWQVDPRLGEDQSRPPDLYSLGFVKRENRNRYRIQYHRHPNFEGYMHPLEH